jgi:hypothetical protein
MYIVASQWKFGDPTQAQEAITRFRAALGPYVRQQPGSQFWYLVATGADEALTLTGWDEQAHYETAAPLLAAKVQELVGDLDARVLQRRRGPVVAMALRESRE